MEKVTFQFPRSSFSSLSILLRSFSSSSSSGRVEKPFRTERQITSGAAAMGPNTAPANTTETHTHRHTLVPVRPEMLPCGGTKEFSACSLFMHTAQVLDVQLSQQCKGTVLSRLNKAGKESLCFRNPSH